MLQVKQQILAGFKSCGYKNNLLKESYQYFDGVKDRTAEIVGFSQPIYNASTACIAAIDKTKLNGNGLEAELSSYQLLGCPVLLVYDDSGLQFWKNSGIKVALQEQIESKKLNNFFSRYGREFSPERIYRAKTFGRVKKDFQLSFCDLGLMSIVEEQEGKYLSALTERIIRSLRADCGTVKEDSKFEKWLFQAGFWLIGAKILKDKGVEGFKTLKISAIEDLVNKIQGHYNAAQKLDISNNVRRKALEKVAKEIVEPVSSFAHLTIESLAYVYENTLTNKETRKVLGTHATPSWLVNYIIWGLIDWIEAIPQENRIILEPACGHAPFLTAGAKLLADPLLYKGDEKGRHDYLKRHLIGIDMDSFAEEIARLALTLADIPNPNGWNIQHSDIYEDDILKKAARKATILFCNPPFENFSTKEKQRYGNAITTGNKAAEILAKTLPHMSANSVFGIILPQGFLHRKNLSDLRKYILANFELRTICNLPENVFAKAGHLSTVLLARKKQQKANTVVYLRIRRNNIEHFKNTYQSDGQEISQNLFYELKDYSFRIPELKEIWDYCECFDRLNTIVGIGKGLIFKGKDDLPTNSITFAKTPFKGGVLGFESFNSEIKLTELPQPVFLNLDENVILRPSWGKLTGNAQVLMNYTRVSSGPWRIKAWIDKKGHPVTSNFLVARSKDIHKWSLNSIWALLNSPYANAFAYCHSMERSNTGGVMRMMPIPEINDIKKNIIDELVSQYFSIFSSVQNNLVSSNILDKAKGILLNIDAEILQLYDLPPRLEKMLLDFFAGNKRKGVDFTFDRYYPEGFDSYIPLHMYISAEFQNSSVENVKKWIENNRSPEVIEAFKAAVKVKK